MRNLGLTHINTRKLTRPAATTGAHPLPASRGADTHPSNVIRLSSVLPDSRADLREPSIPDETGLACALAVIASCFVVALSALLYAGYNLFFLFDFG